MICRRSFVSGRVQGVFYRGSCVRRAQDLGLTGYARNLADGRVEVLACGEQSAVDAFVAWLWEGSPSSKVTDVATEAASANEAQRIVSFTSA
jgi:acylphosphatase